MPQYLVADLLDTSVSAATELVHCVPRSSDADGSASIPSCNTGAGSKTHRAVAFGVFPNV